MTDDIYTQPLAVIRARRAAIKANIQRLEEEEAGLDNAEQTLLKLRATPPPPVLQLKTHKEYVLHALREAGTGVDLRTLRDRVADLGRDIPMSSFQPLISDMANVDKTVMREDGLISLAPEQPQPSGGGGIRRRFSVT